MIQSQFGIYKSGLLFASCVVFSNILIVTPSWAMRTKGSQNTEMRNSIQAKLKSTDQKVLQQGYEELLSLVNLDPDLHNIYSEVRENLRVLIKSPFPHIKNSVEKKLVTKLQSVLSGRERASADNIIFLLESIFTECSLEARNQAGESLRDYVSNWIPQDSDQKAKRRKLAFGGTAERIFTYILENKPENLHASERLQVEKFLLKEGDISELGLLSVLSQHGDPTTLDTIAQNVERRVKEGLAEFLKSDVLWSTLTSNRKLMREKVRDRLIEIRGSLTQPRVLLLVRYLLVKTHFNQPEHAEAIEFLNQVFMDSSFALNGNEFPFAQKVTFLSALGLLMAAPEFATALVSYLEQSGIRNDFKSGFQSFKNTLSQAVPFQGIFQRKYGATNPLLNLYSTVTLSNAYPTLLNISRLGSYLKDTQSLQAYFFIQHDIRMLPLGPESIKFATDYIEDCKGQADPLDLILIELQHIGLDISESNLSLLNQKVLTLHPRTPYTLSYLWRSGYEPLSEGELNTHSFTSFNLMDYRTNRLLTKLKDGTIQFETIRPFLNQLFNEASSCPEALFHLLKFHPFLIHPADQQRLRDAVGHVLDAYTGWNSGLPYLPHPDLTLRNFATLSLYYAKAMACEMIPGVSFQQGLSRLEILEKVLEDNHNDVIQMIVIAIGKIQCEFYLNHQYPALGYDRALNKIRRAQNHNYPGADQLMSRLELKDTSLERILRDVSQPTSVSLIPMNGLVLSAEKISDIPPIDVKSSPRTLEELIHLYEQINFTDPSRSDFMSLKDWITQLKVSSDEIAQLADQLDSTRLRNSEYLMSIKIQFVPALRNLISLRLGHFFNLTPQESLRNLNLSPAEFEKTQKLLFTIVNALLAEPDSEKRNETLKSLVEDTDACTVRQVEGIQKNYQQIIEGVDCTEGSSKLFLERWVRDILYQRRLEIMTQLGTLVKSSPTTYAMIPGASVHLLHYYKNLIGKTVGVISKDENLTEDYFGVGVTVPNRLDRLELVRFFVRLYKPDNLIELLQTKLGELREQAQNLNDPGASQLANKKLNQIYEGMIEIGLKPHTFDELGSKVLYADGKTLLKEDEEMLDSEETLNTGIHAFSKQGIRNCLVKLGYLKVVESNSPPELLEIYFD